jgi:tRNA(Ile)-lysidine synthase
LRPDGTISPETAARRFLDSLVQPSRILVAISGGSDSTGLLLSLSDALKAAPRSRISLCAATVDHAMRAESADEARQVAALCRSLGIAHVTKVWQGPKPKAGIMAAARDARYALLAEAAAELAADIIVTAHTLDDQRETLVMRGLRSTANMTGIADAVLYDRRVWVVRPFLQCLRQEIRDCLRRSENTWFDDPSNDDPTYERVRTRQKLAGRGISLEELAMMAAARQELAAGAARWLDAHVSVHGAMLGHLSQAGLAVERVLLGHGLSRLAAVFGGQPFALGREPMGSVLDFVAAGRPGRVTAGRVIFDLRRDGLYLARETRGILPLALAAGERGVWDGRYVVNNCSEVDIVVSALEGAAPTGSLIPVLVTGAQPRRGGAAKDPLAPKDLGALGSRDEHRNEGGGGSAAGNLRVEETSRLPKSALRRALAAQPHISASAISTDLPNQIRIEPYFALFDRFLTRFDFIFADSLAAAFGARPYPKPPLGLIDGKTI